MTENTAPTDAPPVTCNAAQRREHDTRRRYPHPQLIPFVIEPYGRLVQDAIQLLRTTAPTDAAERTESLTHIYHAIGATAQHPYYTFPPRPTHTKNRPTSNNT